jgi:GT2 family glycosyltransferase
MSRHHRQMPEDCKSGTRLVSILIVNYNGANWLNSCLDSVMNIQGVLTEVVVVDNASTDCSLEYIGKYPGVKIVKSSENLGFAGGNNLGLPYCRGEYILLLNNDTVVTTDFLLPLCDYMDQHAEVAIVQGKMILPRYHDTLDVCGSYLTWLGFPYHYGFYKPDGPKYLTDRPVFSAKGACLMFRRSVIREIGGFLFDEDFFCYYEESDFCHRVWLAGYEVHFVSSPPIRHFMGATAGGPQGGFALRHYLSNMTFSLLSNLGAFSLLRIMPFFFTMLLASTIISAITLRKPQFFAHMQALLVPTRMFKKILARRKLIRSIRKTGDSAIFSKTMRNPKTDYFIKTFSGRLDQYQDESC